MFEVITDKELADMFEIPLEQFKKECADGTIICMAEECNDYDKIIEAFNNVQEGYWIKAEDLKKVLVTD